MKPAERTVCPSPPSITSYYQWIRDRNYLINLWRLLEDLAALGHPVPSGLILPEDFPPLPQYLPRALSPEDELRLHPDRARSRIDLWQSSGKPGGETLIRAPLFLGRRSSSGRKGFQKGSHGGGRVYNRGRRGSQSGNPGLTAEAGFLIRSSGKGVAP